MISTFLIILPRLEMTHDLYYILVGWKILFWEAGFRLCCLFIRFTVSSANIRFSPLSPRHQPGGGGRGFEKGTSEGFSIPGTTILDKSNMGWAGRHKTTMQKAKLWTILVFEFVNELWKYVTIIWQNGKMNCERMRKWIVYSWLVMKWNSSKQCHRIVPHGFVRRFLY